VAGLIQSLCQHTNLLLQLIEARLQVSDIPAFTLKFTLYKLTGFTLGDLLGHLHLEELAVETIQVVANDRQLPIRRTPHRTH
jgi:hypothetical protein